MPKVAPQHHEARRRQLLDAARRCFARRGFAETSVRDIYREAGLSAGSVYLHFESKDEIVEALAREILARLSSWHEVLGSSDDPLAALESMVRGVLARAAEASGGELGLRVQAWAAAVTHPPIAAFYAEGFAAMRAALAEALERGQDAGRISRALDADAAARVVIAQLQGFVLQLALDPEADASAYADACVRVLRDALRPEAAAA